MAKKVEPEYPSISFEFHNNNDGTFDIDVTLQEQGRPIGGFGGVMTVEELRALGEQINALLASQ
jgi:hypothetical protein